MRPKSNPRSTFVARLTLCLLGSAATVTMTVPFTPASAQSVDTALSGKISQAGSGAMLSGAVVTIVETGQTAVTDDQGYYRFGNVAPGSYTISIDYIGYPTQSEQVTIAATATSQDVTLGEGERDTVVVTGQRGAQAKALSEQRASDNVRNVVSADQAGRFPDFNAAESLRRVPGVSVQREVDAGEGRYISIRGLDSGLNNT